MRILWITLVAALAGCSRADDDSGFVPTGGASTLPAAVAGADFEVLTGAPGVALNGSKSTDPSGATPTFEWSQTAGPAVTLSDATVASPTFTAPGAPATLTFRLTVTGPNGTDSDAVDVEIKTVLVSALDKWFVGYGKAGTITATVTGGTGPFAYEWTGVKPWVTVSGTATDTLSFTTPALADFQNFPDRAEVGVLERTTQGRLQLKVKVTDATGAFDEDLVNFSAGPFADSVANENAALGEPVFLNGGATTPSGAITSWTWTGTKPNGAAVSFFKPDKTALGGATDQRFVYFVPDLVGATEIILTQSPGGVIKVINLNAGKYVGVGNLIGKTPDPFKGECASCHAGQFGWLADFANPWRETGHASMFERILDPAHPLYAASQAKGHWNDAFDFGSNYSIDSRAVGWSRVNALAHGGWAETATAEGYVFEGTTWEELARKHPLTAGKSNVQCESCHGPGSEHRGDTSGIRKTYDANVCGRCHSRKYDLWEASAHGKPVITSPSGSASCNGCHTAQGYVVEMRAQEGADPHPVLFATSNVNRPVIPLEDRRGTTCQACHEPHRKTAKRAEAGMDPQLRAFGNVKFRNGAVVNAGEAAVCFTCHQSRTDTRAGSPDMNVRRAPHDSTAAEMLGGTNGSEISGWSYASSPHGIPDRFVTPSKGQNRQCLACHADASPAKGQLGYNALGGHTFSMKQGTGAAAATDASHAGGATVAGTKKFAVASGTSLLRQVFTGDTLTLAGGADAGTYTVESVDGARQVTLDAPVPFTGGPPATWTLTSVVKYNTSACTQCHTVALDFQVAARGDYDGDGTPESVQNEIAGLRAALLAAIEAKLSALVGEAATLTPGGGRIRYTKTAGSAVRTFPGPNVTSSDNPDIAWSSLAAAQKGEWQALYQASYNAVFVGNDRSGGIHNTGYAVNLLQSSYQAVTGTTIGSTFVPFP